jgi:hypothetical protein
MFSSVRSVDADGVPAEISFLGESVLCGTLWLESGMKPNESGDKSCLMLTPNSLCSKFRKLVIFSSGTAQVNKAPNAKSVHLVTKFLYPRSTLAETVMKPSFLLNRLPVEILGVIDYFLGTLDKLRLVMCGNSDLLSKFRGGGVRVFELRLDNPELWPETILSYFTQLRHLSLDYQMDLFSAKVNVSYLPTINVWSQSLQTLEMHELAALSAASLKSLPHTLTRLKCDLQSSDLEYCPPSLLSLSIFKAITVTRKTLFPPQLTELEFEASMPNFKPNDLPTLPSSLSRLQLTIYEHINDMLSQISNLEQLQSLQLITDTQFDTSLLPRHLIELNLPTSGALSSRDLDGMPHDLQILLAPNEKMLQMLDFQKLPSSLTILNVSSNRHINPLVTSTFPKSITELNVDNIDLFQGPAEDVKMLPPNLRYLSMCSFVSSNREVIQHLPRTITELRMNIWTVGSLTEEDIAHLPPGITRLNLDLNPNLSSNVFSKLPPKLRFLCIDQLVDTMTDTYVAALPRNLIHFTLPVTSRLTSSACADFPRSLLTLYVPPSISTQFLKDGAHMLPKNMRIIGKREPGFWEMR